MIRVEVGQKWLDRDRREAGRYVIVQRLDGEYALCRATGKNGTREVHIRLNRFGKAWTLADA